MSIINGDFTNGLTGWTTKTVPCMGWLQSISPEPPNVHIKAQACAISIYQDFTIDNTTLTFDWNYYEQYGSYGGCDAHSSWSLTRVSDSALLKGSNITGSECGANSGMVIEDVSAYIGTPVRIQFNLYPSIQWFAYQSELLIGQVCVSPNLGTLDISGTPSGAQIFLDGTDTGFITPKIITDITPASHTILLKNTGYYDNYTTIITRPCRTNIINPILTLIVGLKNGTFDTDLSGWTYNPTSYWPYCNNATMRYATQNNGRAEIWAGYCTGAYLTQTFNIEYSTLKFDYEVSTPSSLRNPSSPPSWSLIVHNPPSGDITAYNESLPMNGSGTIQRDVSAYVGKSVTLAFNTGGVYPSCSFAYCGGADYQGQYLWIDNVNVFLTSIDISPSTANIAIGDTQQFIATCKDQNGNTMTCPTIIYTVIDPTKGSISDTGLFTGMSEGSTTVTATDSVSGIYGSGIVTIVFIPVLTSIDISPSTADVAIGDTQQFTAICKDQNDNIVMCQTIIWSIIDPTKGSISDTGLFTGISEGTTTVMATDSVSGLYGSGTVTVFIPILTSIDIIPSTANIAIGYAQQFTATCKYQNTNFIDCPTITWTVIDPTKGSISTTGLFTGISEGTTTVMATSGTVSGVAVVNTAPIQAGFGNIGNFLAAGLFFGLLIPKKCSDNKTKEKCEKEGCEWINGKCVKRKK